MNIIVKQIINNNFKSKYYNLLEYLKTSEDTDLINNIKNTLEMINKEKDNILELEKDEAKIQDQDIQNHMYNKEWIKLTNIHKIIKIKEYFKYMAETEYKNNIVNELVKLVNNNKLKNNNYVIYDKKNKKIIDIPIVILLPNSEKGFLIKLD